MVSPKGSRGCSGHIHASKGPCPETKLKESVPNLIAQEVVLEAHTTTAGHPGTTFQPASQAFSGDQDTTTVLHQKVRIDINRSANDTTSFPVKALIKDLLRELQKASPSTMILPIDDTAPDGALSMESDIPTNGEDLNKYFGGFQDAPGNSNKDIKVIRVFLRISSPMSIRDFKRNNSFFGWLKSNHFFMRAHGFSTSYDVVSAGFISRMSPTLHRRDTLNTIIQEIAQVQHPDIEIRLTPSRIPSGKGNDKRYTMAVEVQVDRKHLQTVRELMIEIFETKQDVLPNGIFFVPTPTNGISAFKSPTFVIAKLRRFAMWSW